LGNWVANGFGWAGNGIDGFASDTAREDAFAIVSVDLSIISANA
jgi:hypothetical protein